MAQQLREDMSEKKIPVNREKLLSKLQDNRKKHIAEYDEAMATYREVLLAKIDEGFETSKKQMEVQYKKVREETKNLSEEDIKKQRDTIVLFSTYTVDMRVPKSYVDEYDVAIQMVEWDVRENVELTYSEFVCFVQDKWHWKSAFDEVSTIYKTMKMSR